MNALRPAVILLNTADDGGVAVASQAGYATYRVARIFHCGRADSVGV
jgi:hypothetical protein